MTNSPRWPAVTARMVSGCWLHPRTASGRLVPQRDGACYDEAVRAWEASCRLAVLRAEAAMFHPPLPVHLLDGPTADLQELGQFPLAHSLRPLHPDVLSLLLAQAGPSARETAFGPRLRLAGDRLGRCGGGVRSGAVAGVGSVARGCRCSGPGSTHPSGGPESHGEASCRPLPPLFSTDGGSYAAEKGFQGLEARGLRPGRAHSPGRGWSSGPAWPRCSWPGCGSQSRTMSSGTVQRSRCFGLGQS